MAEQPGKARPYKFVEDGGLIVDVGATTVEQTGLKVGHHYRLTARGAMALARWGTDDASAADGGFDLAVGANQSVDVVAQATAINVIEAEAGSTETAVLAIQELDLSS